MSDAEFADDPVSAIERLIEESKKPRKPRSGPIFLLHHREYEKAARGEPFICYGVLCRLGPNGFPEPVPKI